MRLFLLVFLTLFGFGGAAGADQTDPRLDTLFEDLRTGEALDAQETANRIIAIWSDAPSDTVDLLFQRAKSSADAGAYDLAAALLDHVTGLAPNFAEGYALRGVVRLAQEDREGALADFSTTLTLEPRHFDVRIALADLLAGGGETREAYDMFQKALECNPHDDYASRRDRSLRRDLDGQEI